MSVVGAPVVVVVPAPVVVVVGASVVVVGASVVVVGASVVVVGASVVVVVAAVVVVVAPVVVVVAPVVVVVAPVVVVVAPVVVVVAPVVEVVAPVVEVEAPDVVVPPATVVVGSVSEPNRAMPTARSPAWSPMASTQVSPAACCAAVGGHGKFAASVAATPEVVHPLMTDVDGTVWVQVGVPTVGGPVVPVATVLVPASTPAAEMLVRASLVQLMGMSLPRKRIWGCVGSELHCSIEAREPAVKCAPLIVTTSPPASPEHTGAEGLVLLHVTPGAVEVSDSVCVAADALVTLVTSIKVPMTRVSTPVAVSNLEVFLKPSTSPPVGSPRAGPFDPPRAITLQYCLPALPLLPCWYFRLKLAVYYSLQAALGGGANRPRPQRAHFTSLVTS